MARAKGRRANQGKRSTKPQKYEQGYKYWDLNPFLCPMEHMFGIDPPQTTTPSEGMEDVEYVYTSYPNDSMVHADEPAAWPNPYKTTSDVMVNLVESCFERFMDTQDPVRALEVVVAAHAAKVYPPLPVMECLVKGIQEYLASDWVKALDHCLKLQGKNNVRRKPLTEQKQRQKYYDIFLHMWIWRDVLGLAEDLAIHAVASWCGLSVSTIEKYRTHTQEYPDWQKMTRAVKESFDTFYREALMQEGSLRVFVSKYSLDALKGIKVADRPISEDILRLHQDFVDLG